MYRRRIPIPIVLLVSLAGLGLGCQSSGIRLELELPEVAAGAPVVFVAAVDDARVFGEYGSLGRQHSVQGDAGDRALTERVVGRRLVADTSLGGNISLAPGQTVASLVRDAVIGGLREAGLDARPGDSDAAGTRVVRAELIELWLRERRHTTVAAIGYRAELRLRGDVPGLASGQLIQVDASVSGGAADMDLWRKALRRAMESISERVGERVKTASIAGSND